MMAISNITKGKNKLIISGIAGVLGALILLTAIHIAAKMAVIVSAAVVTYSVLSLIHWINNNKSKCKKLKTNVTDDGYCSAEEDKKVLSAKEQEEIEIIKEEELKNKREQERMKNKSLGGPINMFGEPINSKQSSEITAQNNANDESIVMKSLPEHMNALGNPLLDKMPADTPNTYINTNSSSNENVKLSPIMLERLTMEYILSQRD